MCPIHLIPSAMRKNIYKWHRTISLIIAIPVLLWSVSGFMHPIMTNIRPKLATQWLAPAVFDSSKIKTPLQQALQLNGVDTFQSVRIIHIDTNFFYQVKTSGNSIQYFSTLNGKLLPKGDWIYAQYLARLFLEGQPKDSANTPAIVTEEKKSVSGDCCTEAAECVLKPKSGAPFKDVQLVTSFSKEYKNINRVLPVYKVEFERADNIRVYVETEQDRFCLAVDKNRAWFSSFFSLLHNMEWLNVLGKGRLFAEMIFTALAFLSTLMGIYIFFITKSKAVKNNPAVRARRNHRYTAIVFSLFTLMFTLSGFVHTFSKLTPDTRDQYFVQQQYASAAVNFNFKQLQATVHQPVYNISLVTLDATPCWQVYVKQARKKTAGDNKPKDLMKSMSAPAPQVIYIDTASKQIIPDGEKKYAAYLATVFSKNNPGAILSSAVITKFEGEYGFVNKRLPVWRISYGTNSNERYYVETSSGKLGARIDDKDLLEANTFNYFHKHHFMDFAGKSWRDFSTMFWVAAQIAMVIIGFILYLKTKNRKVKL